MIVFTKLLTIVPMVSATGKKELDLFIKIGNLETDIKKNICTHYI